MDRRKTTPDTAEIGKMLTELTEKVDKTLANSSQEIKSSPRVERAISAEAALPVRRFLPAFDLEEVF